MTDTKAGPRAIVAADGRNMFWALPKTEGCIAVEGPDTAMER